jgi:tetratricopeptide (TPR) repeat protein
MHLPESTFSAIAALMNKAAVEIGRNDYPAALQLYQKAAAAFPPPVEDYTGACFLWYSMAQVHLLMQQETQALTYTAKALGCLDGFNDAKVWYQSGLLQLRLGKLAEAREDLAKAFAGGGKAVFVGAQPAETTFFKEHIFLETINPVQAS